MFTLLSAILHLTNIRFAHDDETDGVFIEDEFPLEIGNYRQLVLSSNILFGFFLKIILAKVYDYLLEKSRVVQHGPGERNYHIFYYLFSGLEKEELEYYYLETPENHR